MTHNARHQPARDFRSVCAGVPRLRGAAIVRWADFSGEFGEGDGQKNRRLRQCKISIREVLISVRLTVCGEVAERLKAAVCYTEIRLSTISSFLS